MVGVLHEGEQEERMLTVACGMNAAAPHPSMHLVLAVAYTLWFIWLFFGIRCA